MPKDLTFRPKHKKKGKQNPQTQKRHLSWYKATAFFLSQTQKKQTPQVDLSELRETLGISAQFAETARAVYEEFLVFFFFFCGGVVVEVVDSTLKKKKKKIFCSVCFTSCKYELCIFYCIFVSINMLFGHSLSIWCFLVCVLCFGCNKSYIGVVGCFSFCSTVC